MEADGEIASWDTNTTVGMNFWSGAITTYTDSYFSFRCFVLDEQTMLPITIKTYRIDVLAKEPEFVLDHSLTAYYSMVDLSPSSFDQLSAHLLTDE